uniref:carboxypeptidase-like regulatory domain-containing protein n=1 Tax=Pararhizobium sp. IMCC3301 TaxID=3067904 RepID=UPI002740A221|nr:carboxypeptidase-like regulatory domain-containing protein [Pararhizobium sp. IMCC3301]
MQWRPILLNRFVVTIATVMIIALLWNLYVSFNDGGSVRGQVITSDGSPLVGAMVKLSRKTVTSVEMISETTSDADGMFSFNKHGEYALVITVSVNDATSDRTVVPLWFRNQDIVLEESIIVNP